MSLIGSGDQLESTIENQNAFMNDSAVDGRPVTPTMKEVAAHADVALSSVSRVLNDHPDVSEAMRRRVLEAIDMLGYEPNLVASSLRSGMTSTIGFVVSNISNPLFADVVMGASTKLQPAGYSVILTNSEGRPERDENMLRVLRWRRVDGLITSLTDEHRPGTIAELERLDVPVVLLDRQVNELEGRTSVVAADHASGMQSGVEHLLDLGHRRIALISGSLHIRPPKERLAGYRAAYASRGLEPPADLLALESFAPGFGEKAATEMLALRDPPTAIVAGGNLLLTGVLRAIRSAGLRAGADIAVVSCDHIALAELHDPPITIIERDTVGMGAIAADMLLERLKDPEVPPRTERVPTELVVRGSTPPLR